MNPNIIEKNPLKALSKQQIERLIHMAWQDRITFEEIKETYGLKEAEVIKLMRRELKPSSFRLWRKRVSGRKTKHRKLFNATQEH